MSESLQHAACQVCFDQMNGVCRVYRNAVERCGLRKAYDRGAGKEQIVAALETSESSWNLTAVRLERHGLTVVGRDYLEKLEATAQAVQGDYSI